MAQVDRRSEDEEWTSGSDKKVRIGHATSPLTRSRVNSPDSGNAEALVDRLPQGAIKKSKRGAHLKRVNAKSKIVKIARKVGGRGRPPLRSGRKPKRCAAPARLASPARQASPKSPPVNVPAA